MLSGRENKILFLWFSLCAFGNILLNSAALAANTPDEICGRKILRVGTENNKFEPFLFSEEVIPGEKYLKRGIDIDVVRIIQKNLCRNEEIQVEVLQAPFYQLFERLRRGQFDVLVAALTINSPDPQRRDISYSYPYYLDGGQALAIRGKAQKELQKFGLPGLKGKTIYVMKGTTGAMKARRLGEKYPSLKIVEKKNIEELFQSAHENNGEIILLGFPVLNYSIKAKHKNRGWAILEANGRPVYLTREHFGVAAARGNYALLNRINEILYEQHETGTLNENIKRWFNMPAGGVKRAEPAEAKNAPKYAIRLAPLEKEIYINWSFINSEVDTSKFSGSLKLTNFQLSHTPIGQEHNPFSIFRLTMGSTLKYERTSQKGSGQKKVVQSKGTGTLFVKESLEIRNGIIPKISYPAKLFIAAEPGYTLLENRSSSGKSSTNAGSLSGIAGVEIFISGRVSIAIEYEAVFKIERPREVLSRDIKMGLSFKF